MTNSYREKKMAENMKQTVLEEGTEFDGTVKSKVAIIVSGQLKGQISAPALTVTQSGMVNGKVKVSQLKSQGEISGEIDADSVELSGRVSDQTRISAKSIEVKLNQNNNKLQMTFGNCELNVGDKAGKTMPEMPAAADGKGKKDAPVAVN